MKHQSAENSTSVEPKLEVATPKDSADSSGGASPQAVRDEVVSDDLPRDVRAQLNYTLVGYDESADPEPDTPSAGDEEVEVEGGEASSETPEPEAESEPEPEPEVEEEQAPEEEEPEQPVAPVPAVKRKAKGRRLRRI